MASMMKFMRNGLSQFLRLFPKRVLERILVLKAAHTHLKYRVIAVVLVGLAAGLGGLASSFLDKTGRNVLIIG